MDIDDSAQDTDRGAAHDTTTRAPEPATSFWRRLFHRWFVEYNPLYLVSALLVLGGLTVISGSTAESQASSREALVAVIAELYAFALIAGAALLVRIGLRRPAVMLALLTALYQCDLTLLTESQVHLGLGSALWIGLFIAKLRALAWAMQVRLSRSAIVVPAVGALGLAIMPHVLLHFRAYERGSIVAVWLFALFATGLWTSREVTSIETLDAWGQTVLARTQRAIWVMWAAASAGHALFWCDQFGASAVLLMPSGILLATRFMRAELRVWAAVTGALLFTGAVAPESFWLVALLAAVTLTLRALRRPTPIERVAESPSDATPYRASGAEAPLPRFQMGFARSERAPMLRLLTGAIVGVYLSLWTFGWQGGPLPHHTMMLEASLLAALLVMAYRARTRLVLTPLAPAWLHAGLQAGLIAAPASTLQWGITSVGVGFVLLLGSLLVAFRLRAAPDTSSP